MSRYFEFYSQSEVSVADVSSFVYEMYRLCVTLICWVFARNFAVTRAVIKSLFFKLCVIFISKGHTLQKKKTNEVCNVTT